MGTGSVPRVKLPGLGLSHPSEFSSEVKERVELYIYDPSGSSWSVIRWTFPRVKLPGLGLSHPTEFSSEVKE